MENKNMIYKYYSFLPNDYLLYPTLKLAIPSKLNDPFESIVPYKVRIKHINDMLIKHDISDQIRIDYIRLINSMLISGLSSTGIISMTENPKNMLMWSHYANSHKGLVIGYRKDVLSHLTNPYGIDACFHNTPQKVIYNHKKFDRTPNKNRAEISRNDIIKYLLTTKNHHWRYEKERRFIIPLGCANYVKSIQELNAEQISSFEQLWGLEYIKNKQWFETKHIDSKKDDSYRGTFTINEEAELFLLNKKFDAFLKINSKSICSIYYGVNFEESKRNEITKIIKENQHLSHINSYQCSINQDRLALNTEAL